MIMQWIFPIAFCSILCLKVNGYKIEDLEQKDQFHPDLNSGDEDSIHNPHELNAEYWRSVAQDHLQQKLQAVENNNRAKNVILFIGDGMSIQTITATRTFINGENTKLSFEKFPFFGLSKTYCVNRQVPDSACTATAYLSGVKGNYGTIGVNAKVPRRHCTKGIDPATHTESIAKWAQDAGKAAGLVTTARVTHASPAGVYAHIANREWENDEAIYKDGCSAKLNTDIAQQLVHWSVGRKLNVILGGGRAEFRNKTARDEENEPGHRIDGRDLIKEWLKDRKTMGNASYIWNRDGLLKVKTNQTEYLLGLFSSSHCPFHGDIERDGLKNLQPTLTEMTETAIKVLNNNKNGYFLFVEGARIDMAHHETRARKALEDTEEFANAIQKARELTSDENTLIVVTSDHSHTMTINGYPSRGNDILGLSGNKGDDKLPYTTISYANGPGYYNAFTNNGPRRDVSRDNFNNPNYQYMATVPLNSETHGGDDVGVFAVGPKAHLFTGNYEQNNIPMLLAYSAEIGPYRLK